MDPGTITTVTGTIIKLVSTASTTLHTLIKETNNIDQTVKDLAAEVDGLMRTLLEADSVVRQPSVVSIEKRIATTESEALWDTFYGCLEDCQITVVRLGSALDGIDRRPSNWARQALRQVKLNLKKDEINSLRNQIHTHSITISTALQLVNIRTTYLSSGAVVDGLVPRLDSLQKSLDDMTASLRDPKNSPPSTPQLLTQLASSNTQKLHFLGTRVLAKATTVYGSSVGHTSVYGDEMDNKATLQIMNWISEPILHDRTYSTSPRTSVNGHQTTASVDNSSTDMAESQLAILSNGTDVIDSDPDSEAEFEFEIAQGLLNKGKERFESANYKEAISFLQKGVAACNQLPQHLKPQLDVIEIPLMIATCKYYLEEIDQAYHDLTILNRIESSSDEDAIRKCQVSHLLSQICLLKNEASEAELHCRNSLRGRRRLLGKTHRDYFESLSLLSEIYVLHEKDEEAAVFKAMLPSGFQYSTDMVRLKTLLDSRDPVQTPEGSAMQAQQRSHGPWANQSTQQPITSPVQVNIGDVSNPTPYITQPSDPRPLAHTTQTSLHRRVSDTMSQILVGHNDLISGTAFSPNGQVLASASKDKMIRLWDPETGQVIRKLKGHTQWVNVVAFSADGSILVSASKDKTIRLWNTKTGWEVRKLKGHTDTVFGVAFSTDGSLLASSSTDRTITLWDPVTGREGRRLKGHTDSVVAVAFSPNGSLLASTSVDRTVILWDPKTGREVRQLQGHTDAVLWAAFSPDGSLLASASKDKIIRFWNPETGQEVRKLEGYFGGVSGATFSPDGSHLASSSADNTVRIWNVETGQEVQRLEHSSRSSVLAFYPDGSLLASGTKEGVVRVWKALK